MVSTWTPPPASVCASLLPKWLNGRIASSTWRGMAFFSCSCRCWAIWPIGSTATPIPKLIPRAAQDDEYRAALVLLVSVLAEPVFAWWSKQVIKPLVLVLVDTSASMNTTERGTTRLQQIAAVIADAGWRSRLAQAEIRAWGFAESVYPLALDTAAVVQAGGQATNIGHALVASLESIDEREQVQGFILLSDGGHNLGRDLSLIHI